MFNKLRKIIYVDKIMKIEKGSRVLCWDEAFVEEAPSTLGGGVEAPRITLDYKKEETESFGHRIRHFLHEKHIF